MNPTALKLGADVVAADPSLQVGAGLLVFAAGVVLLALFVLYLRSYQRGEDI